MEQASSSLTIEPIEARSLWRKNQFKQMTIGEITTMYTTDAM